MLIDKETSTRIDLLRFPLAYGVVWAHAMHPAARLGYWRQDGLAGGVVFFENFISWVLCHQTLPMFLLISGFLFFKDYELTYKCTMHKVQRRVRSLLIPFLLWNMIAFVCILCIQTIRPDLAPYFNQDRTLIRDYGILDFFNGLLGIRDHYLYDLPTWFIRDIFLMALLSPLVWTILKKLPTVLSLLLLGVLMFSKPLCGFQHTVIIFYSLGALISIKSIRLEWIDKWGREITIVFIILGLLQAYFKTIDIDYWWLPRLVGVFGVAAVWSISKRLLASERAVRVLLKLAAFSFILYAVHSPVVLNAVRGLFHVLLPYNTVGVLTAYVMAPAVAVILLVCGGHLLRRQAPAVFSVLNGRRWTKR